MSLFGNNLRIPVCIFYGTGSAGSATQAACGSGISAYKVTEVEYAVKFIFTKYSSRCNGLKLACYATYLFVAFN